MKHIDSQSKEYFTDHLSRKGWTEIAETDQYCYYDISAKAPNGRLWRFELKQRNMPSTRYNDTIMETQKLNNFLKDKDDYDGAALITFFTDRWTISNIFHPVYQDIIEASHTTSFEDNSIVQKSVVHYLFNKTYYYEAKSI